MENIKIIETLSDGTQKELSISDIINRFLIQKTEEYIGDVITNKRVMIDWNGINVITENDEGNIIRVDCKENIVGDTNDGENSTFIIVE
jgi:hypothetical protein